jgi:hypothetical protein
MRIHRCLVGVLLAAVATPASAQDPVAESELDQKLRKVMAPFVPEIEETAQLMYGIGACERHFRPATVDFYIREYMTAPAPEGLEGAYVEGTQQIYRNLYTQGRADAAKLGLDATQCQRVADAGIAAVKKAIADRKAAFAADARAGAGK